MDSIKKSRNWDSIDALEGLLENGCTKPRLLYLPVTLIGKDKLRTNCIATSVSLRGILLHADSITANKSETVELQFKLNFAGFSKNCHIIAKLVGIGKYDVVVDFCKFNHQIFRYIYKLMYDFDLREAATVVKLVAPSTFHYGRNLKFSVSRERRNNAGVIAWMQRIDPAMLPSTPLSTANSL